MKEEKEKMAVEYWNLHDDMTYLEMQMREKIEDILNIDSDPTKKDNYSSILFLPMLKAFEIHGCKHQIKPTSEQLNALWKLGFERFWIRENKGFETRIEKNCQPMRKQVTKALYFRDRDTNDMLTCIKEKYLWGGKVHKSDSNNQPALSSCPFCGEKARSYIWFDMFSSNHFYICSCTSCNARIHSYTSEYSCRKEWNNRADKKNTTTKNSP